MTCDELKDLLRECRAVILELHSCALGSGGREGEGQTRWSVRDVLVDKINRALAAEESE